MPQNEVSLKTVLVTGGAGYIGSVTTDLLIGRGDRVVVIDDLSRGQLENVHPDAVFVQADIGDRGVVEAVAVEYDPDAVIHFAGYIAVGESVRNPGSYLDRNVARSTMFLDSLVRHDVSNVVFSSSAAVYGQPKMVPIDENEDKQPTSPYGWTKWAFEQILGFYEVAYGTRHVALRYFNAAGATERRVERHDPETHLIPNILESASGGKAVSVFGTDYPTRDGTAIRDYVHVADLADAHLRAVDYLIGGGASMALNLGSGIGLSVMDVIETIRRVTGREVPVEFGDRRAGDPTQLVADPSLARQVLAWEANQSDLDNIVRSSWAIRPA
jgi:UDP-glucose-4-epimerase GalE